MDDSQKPADDTRLAARVLAAVDRTLLGFLKWFTVGLFALLFLILVANIVNRLLHLGSLHWFDEIEELLYAWLVFYGAAAVWICKGHFSVGDWISRRIASAALRRAYRVFIELGSLAFSLVFLWYSFHLARNAQEMSPVFGIPKTVHYSCMPISALIMSLYAIKNLAVEASGRRA